MEPNKITQEKHIDENIIEDSVVRNHLITSINNKYNTINDGLNNLYNSSQLAIEVQMMKNRLNQISNIEKMGVDELRKVDTSLNSIIHDYSKLSQKAEEMKATDNFKIKQQEQQQTELNTLTTSLQNRYGSNWVASMTDDEKNRFVSLYSSVHNISHEQVEKNIEDSISKLYYEKINKIKDENQKQEELKRQQTINQQFQSTLQQLVDLRKEAIQLFNNDIHNETLNRLLHSFVSVYNIRESKNITSEQLDKLYEVYNQFDLVIKQNKKITQQREQISQLISDFKDYRSQPKINNELMKVEQKFEQLKHNASGEIVTEQQKLIDWLTNAKNTMLTKLQEKQEELKEPETNEPTNEYQQMINELDDTKSIEQEQTLNNFNDIRNQVQKEIINKRLAEIYSILGPNNVYQQIENEMNYGGFNR